jgi:hypothetical protein
MTVSSVKTGYDGISLLVGNAAYDPAATFLIQRVAGTGSSGTITFSSIPQNYKHLQVRFNVLNSSTTGFLRYQLNGDTGANYAIHRLDADGSAVAAAGATGIAYGQLSLGSPDANNPYVGIIDIHDYASTTKYKTNRTFWGRDTNGAGNLALASSLWLNTAAVNSITIFWSSNNFTTSSTIALYGMVG